MFVAALPWILSLLGTGAKMAADKQASDAQQREVREDTYQQGVRQSQIDDEMQSEVAKLRDNTGDAERRASLEGFMQQLRANTANAQGGAVRGSDRFNSDTETANAAIKNYGTGRADTLSRVAGPGFQRMNENRRFARVGDTVKGIARDANAEHFLSQMRMQRIRPNQGLSALGSILQGAAGGMAANSAAISETELLDAARNATVNNSGVFGEIGDLARKFGSAYGG